MYINLFNHMCHFVRLAFSIYASASWFHPPRTWNLSEWWNDQNGFYKLPEYWNSSHWENFVGLKISVNPKVQDQRNTAVVVRYSSQVVSISTKSAKSLCLALSWWKTTLLWLTNFGCFSLILAFNQFNYKHYLFESSIWFSRRHL